MQSSPTLYMLPFKQISCMKNLPLLLLLLSAAFTATSQETRPVQFSWGVENLPENLLGILLSEVIVLIGQVVQI